MDFKETIQRELEHEKLLLEEHKSKLKYLPEGCLTYKTIGERRAYYHVQNKTRKQSYIDKKNRSLIESLKMRKHFEVLVERLITNIKGQERLLRSYQPYTHEAIQADVPKAYKFEEPNFSQQSKGGTVKKFKDQPLHTTQTGEIVRSKTEVMIVESLSRANIQFEYERPLDLKKEDGTPKTIFPDFTLETKYGEHIFWEHFGKLDDPTYRAHALEKLELYMRNNIMPSINLLITAEGEGGAIDTSTIQRTVEMLQQML